MARPAVICLTPVKNEEWILDSFMRGNRDSEERRSDGSVPQALNLMNDGLVMSRSRASGTGATASFARQLLIRYPQAAMNQQLIAEMFLTVLSRRPTPEETAEVAAQLAARPQEKPACVQELAWALLTSAEFRFNH